MSVWYVVPSATDKFEATSLPLWQSRGYRVAVFRNAGASPFPKADMVVMGKYYGYTRATNDLCRAVFETDTRADVVIAGGDDIDPDPHATPDQVVEQFKEHFGGTFGVMQPTGDRWMIDESGKAASERICGSPWLGKDFIRRMYQGKGAFCEAYFHFFCDEELWHIATKLEVLWQRRDLTHHHHHWSREGRPRPKYLHPARLNWDDARVLFNRRREAGFPGHEPLAVAIA